MRIDYKWIALSNTTLGMLMASVNQSIVVISLPAIFAGLRVDPLGPNHASLLLWILIGYSAVLAILLVTFGRISDLYGRVRFYNLGFALFTLGSLLCALTPSSGDVGAYELIAFRVVQGVGGAFLSANSVAIITDAFAAKQRGMALGFNQMAFIGGNLVGVVLGGLLATVNWRLVFLVNVPVGLFGSVWSYLNLRELSQRQSQPPDWWGNATFAGGLLALLGGLTSALAPYRGESMGWSNPAVAASITVGLVLLVAFVGIEARVAYPMFQLRLFRIRAFMAGNLAGLLFGLARGGLQFMLVIWLQGIWLPLHGVSFAQTPLQAGLRTMPLLLTFSFFGPIGGWLSDLYGARILSTIGMLVQATGLLLLTTLPANFEYPTFATYLAIIGLGHGLFSAPNTAQIMSSVPPQHRGVASGMRLTMISTGTLTSTAIFFTLVLSGLSRKLPMALSQGLVGIGLPSSVAASISNIPAGSAIFAALLGYNPLGHLVPLATLSHLPPDVAARLVAPDLFAHLISQPFIESLRIAMTISASLCVVGAIASVLRGRRVSPSPPELAPDLATPLSVTPTV